MVTGKAQLEESLALLNKHKTSEFRTSMLMKRSRPGAGVVGGWGWGWSQRGGGGDGMGGGGDGMGGGGGGYRRGRSRGSRPS